MTDTDEINVDEYAKSLVTVEDTPTPIYLAVPAIHEGSKLKWTLECKEQVWINGYLARQWGRESIKVRKEDYRVTMDIRASYETIETTITLHLDYEFGELMRHEKFDIESVLDKDILNGVKVLLNRKQTDFRMLLLKEGPVQICPTPKK